MSDNKTTTVKIFRFDPKVDSQSKYVTYNDVPYEGMTVFGVLKWIQENKDATLGFRYGCTRHFCRACPVMVNGQGSLSCNEPASENMTIDPHESYEIIKDLIVDFDKPK